MKWFDGWFKQETVEAPVQVVEVINPIANFDKLGHLSTAQRLEYVRAEARRVVNEAREEIRQNKGRLVTQMEAANAKAVARIRAAEAAYEKVKAEVK